MGASVQIRLDTANNNFMLLSNIKFIEARVYDDNEEEQLEQTDKVTEEAENEDVVISEALKCGTDLVNSAFEKVAINDSDTESDEESEREVYVLQPKNSYHLRSLPNIIGTKEWVTDDKVGLGDDEREAEVMEDEETESESEDEDVQGESKPDVSDYSESENEETNNKISPPPKNDADNELSDGDTDSEFSDDDDDDLFKPKIQKDSPKAPTIVAEKSDEEEEEDNDKDEDDQVSTDIRVVKKTSFADELALKIGGKGSGSSKPKFDTEAEEVKPRKDDKPSVPPSVPTSKKS